MCSIITAKKQKGFTLVETLMYIALFSVVITGIVMSSYPLITGTERLSQRVTAESEAMFVLHKIGSALSSASSLSVSGGNTLTVTPLSGSPYSFSLNGAFVEKNGIPLSVSRVTFSNFSVSAISDPPAGAGNVPHTVTVSFDADEQSFSQTYHVYY